MALVDARVKMGSLRTLLRDIDRRRWMLYVLVVAMLSILVASSYAYRRQVIGMSTILPPEYVQSRAYGMDFSGTVRDRPVLFAELPVRTEGSGGGILGWSIYGEYSPWTGQMKLSSLLQEPENGNNLLLTARHEIGHALFDDIVAEDCGPGALGFVRTMAVVNSSKFVGRKWGGFIVLWYPEDVQAIYRAYLSSPPPVGYDGESDVDLNVNEFFAETYANLLTGFRPEPAMMSVFRSHSDPLPATANGGYRVP